MEHHKYKAQLELVLKLMEAERHHAETHAERNVYQHVIRLELEALLGEVNNAIWNEDNSKLIESGKDSIPF